MHISTSINEVSNTTDYHVHNIQSMYDISYYTNMIDIHIDKPLVITMNTYQVNSMIQFLDSIVSEESPSTPSLLEEIPQESPAQQETTQSQPSVQNNLSIAPKFNINAISLWVQSITFEYYMPAPLLPFAQKSFTVVGKDKDQELSKPTLSSFAVPKSMLRSVFTVNVNAIEAVANIYDNQFYSADLLLSVHDVFFLC